MIHHQRAWHGGVYTHFIPQWSCYCVPVLWAVMVVIQSAICWYLQVDISPFTKCKWACWSFCQGRYPQPLHIAWNLHPTSVHVLADVHRRSHSFPLIHPRQISLTWCWVMARPSSSCGISCCHSLQEEASLGWGCVLGHNHQYMINSPIHVQT